MSTLDVGYCCPLILSSAYRSDRALHVSAVFYREATVRESIARLGQLHSFLFAKLPSRHVTERVVFELIKSEHRSHRFVGAHVAPVVGLVFVAGVVRLDVANRYDSARPVLEKKTVAATKSFYSAAALEICLSWG